MRVPRELLVLFVLLLLAAVATQQIAGGVEDQEQPDLLSDSSSPGGARGLFLWLQSLGYRVERLEYRDFQPDSSAGVMLLLAPVTPVSIDETDALHQWVENGGTLIIAGSVGLPTPQLIPGVNQADESLLKVLDRFDLSIRPMEPVSEATPSQPLLLHPPVTSALVAATSFVTGTGGLAPYLGTPERPVAAGTSVGKGKVYVLASNYALSNKGIAQADNGALLLNWLPAPETSGVVVFDEVHHGRTAVSSLAYVMVREPWGWAVIYMLGMVFFYLALDGRRFGRPAPSIVDTRRVAAEYVVSLSGLLRRGRKANWVAAHYESTLRRHLASACGLDPSIGTQAVAERVSAIDHLPGGMNGRDAEQVLIQLYQGTGQEMSERRLIHLASETDKIIKSCSGRHN